MNFVSLKTLALAPSPRQEPLIDIPEQRIQRRGHTVRNILRFFADGAAKKWPLRGSLKLTVETL